MFRLLLLLVIANLAYFGWNQMQPGSESQTRVETAMNRADHERLADIPALQLLSEQKFHNPEVAGISGGEESGTYDKNEAIQSGSASITEEIRVEPVCIRLVGELGSDAQSVLDVLVDMGFRGWLVKETTVAAPDYWVIFEPRETFEAAQTLSNSVHDAGYDSYVVPSGEYRNGVSLGIYNQKKSADSMATTLSSLQLASDEPVIVVREKLEEGRFIYVRVDEGKDLDAINGQLVTAGLGKSEQAPCPESEENFPVSEPVSE